MKYDVALSFAGEDRKYVEAVAKKLKSRSVKVFYDEFEIADLWGKDLYTHLQNIYQNEARYTVIFISQHYARKLWTNHERKMAQARAFRESREYILPARFDNSEIEGIPPTTGYIDLRNLSPYQCSNLIYNKIVGSVTTQKEGNYNPLRTQSQPDGTSISNIEGIYIATGYNEDGSRYDGKVIILFEGDLYVVRWFVGEDEFLSKGILANNLLSVKGAFTVVYEIKTDGSLVGEWGKGGKEILIPAPEGY